MPDFEAVVTMSPGTPPEGSRPLALKLMTGNARVRLLTVDEDTLKMRPVSGIPNTYAWSAMAGDKLEEHMVCVCRRCGSWYDMDFHEALYCHDGDQDWDVQTLLLPQDGDYVYRAPGITEENS